jgi:hypothetical protein
MTTRRLLWAVLGVASVLWAGSWRIVYLEVTRWHHMDSRLRFSTPSPGLPVITLRIVAGAAPVAVLVAAVLLVRGSRARRR